MEKTDFYRPEWTAGRYHKTKDRSYGLLYNLLEGMAYFFEDDSADFIDFILNTKRNDVVSLDDIHKTLKENVSKVEVEEFCQELVNVGLLTEGLISKRKLREIRKQIGDNRKNKAQTIKKTVQEKLPFLHSDAETAYLEVLEKEGIPFSVMFELTYNCNERCIHCFNPGAARNETEKSTRHERLEMLYDDYEKVIKELKALGVVKIVLSGGDPFVKKDIWKLIDLIYKEGFALDIFTNGLAIIDKIEKLSEYYPNSIGLSIYSNVDNVHDGITNVKGSLQKTKTVARKIVDFGIPLYLKCPIMLNNYETYHTVKLLAKEYGALPQFDINLSDSIDGDVSVGKYLQVKGEKLEKLLRDEDIPLYVGPEVPNFGKKQIDFNDNFCGAGYSTLNISPEGDINPCNSFALNIGNVKENSLKTILETSETLRYWKQLTMKDYEECTSHERCYYCNRCPGQSLIEHGNYLKSSNANCRIAKTRMLVAEKLKTGIDPLTEKTKEMEEITNNLKRIESKSFRNISNNNIA